MQKEAPWYAINEYVATRDLINLHAGNISSN